MERAKSFLSVTTGGGSARAMSPKYCSSPRRYRLSSAFTVLETLARDGAITVRLAGPDCGELISTSGGPVAYGSGVISFMPGDSGDWTVCIRANAGLPRSHQAILGRGPLLVHVSAFAESGVDRVAVLRLASSLEPVR